MLVDAAAVGGGEELVLADPLHRRIHEADALTLHRRLIQPQQELHLVVERYFERVLLERALPGRLGGVNWRQRDSLPLELRIRPSDVHGDFRGAPGIVHGDERARGKSPRAVDQNAHAEADALIARDVLDLLLAGADGFRSQAVDANVGVSGAEAPCRGERRVGDVVAHSLDCGGLRRFGLEHPGCQPGRANDAQSAAGNLDELSARCGHGALFLTGAGALRLRSPAYLASCGETSP